MHANPNTTTGPNAAPPAPSLAPAQEAVNVTVALPPAALLAALLDSPHLLDQIASLVAARLEPKAKTHEWPDRLTVGEAANYLRCKKRRVYDLTSQGRLTVVKDGSRNLYERAELDRHLNLADYERATRRRDRYEQRLAPVTT